jgi:hypothetical protein
MKYLNQAGDPTTDLALLKNRLFMAHAEAMQGKVQQPPTPFGVERVGVQGA